MSYNIDSVEYSGEGRLTISKANLKECLSLYVDDMPECNFLEELNQDELDDPITINQPCWYGEGSGHSYDTLLEILKRTKGHVKLAFIWEGGDSITGLEVNDGIVTKRKAKIVVE